MRADGEPEGPRPPEQGGGQPGQLHPARLPHPHVPHPHLIDAEEDRWRWRARIRQDRRKLFFYRIGVAVVGLLLMVAAALTGPLPGPGGIPLFLLGLAVWASEFEWAQTVMLWFKAQFERYKRWNRGHKTVFWTTAVLCAWTAGYLTMLLSGIPPWLPETAQGWLRNLPGLI